MKETNKKKLLYVASTASHLTRFHLPYLDALKKRYTVLTMADGEGVDFCVRFDKHFFSLANLRSIWQIRRILKQERFDGVYLHTTLAAFLVRSAMLGRRKRPYVFNTVHGYLFSKEGRGLKARVMLLCEKVMKSKTDEIAVMNAEDLEITKEHRLCLGNIHSFYGMGLREQMELPKADPALRSRFTTSERDWILTFVGELSARKNQIFLIRALAVLRDMDLPVKLLLVGEGSERESLQAEAKRLSIEDHVFLLGSCSPVTPYLAITDLYVSASISEGLPFNVMEAMQAGLPILASNTKGQTDLLQDTPKKLYPLDDMTAFIEAVRSTIEAGVRGVGKIHYPILDRYLLSSVLENNLSAMTKGFEESCNRD